MAAGNEHVMTVREVAEMLGVDPRTVASALTANGGDIPSRRIGKRIVVPRDAFLAWFDKSNTEKVAEPKKSPGSAVLHRVVIEAMDVARGEPETWSAFCETCSLRGTQQWGYEHFWLMSSEARNAR